MTSRPRRWHWALVLFSSALIFLAGCSTGSRLHSPNILLIVMDAARADALSCYGYERPTTPNLDKLAAGGLRFTRAVSTSSWTGPSHVSLFTGLTPDEHGAVLLHNWLVERIPTLAELLKRQGYYTGGFSNNPLISSSTNLARGFDRFEAVWENPAVSDSRVPHDSELTNRLVRDFITSGRDGGFPFFVFINYMDVHTPYAPPEPYHSRYLDPGESLSPVADSANYNPTDVHPGGLEPSEQDYRTLRNLYDGALNYLDMRIGELLDYLKESGLEDSTLVIVTSDHGEIFGRWDHFTHSYLLNRPLIHIPLIVSYPPQKGRSMVSDRLVSITDIFHTLVKLTGAEGAAETGAPRTDLLDPEAAGHDCYSTIAVNPFEHKSFPNYRSAGHSLWNLEGIHFIAFGEISRESYDLNGDFDEERNLYPASATTQEIEEEINTFRDRLIAFEERPEDLELNTPAGESNDRVEALRALGYVGNARNAQSHGNEHPHVVQHISRAEFLFGRQRYPEAAAELKTALKMSPMNIRTRRMLGAVYYLDNRFELAVQVMLPLIGNQTNEVSTDLIMSLIHRELGDKARAREHFNNARELGINGSLPEVEKYLAQ